eukprot:CAMPEP_0119318486 /NCGR_PEP_ID=MMETSP1333-20130426/46597_1 /TAXON_ID=418940 /ORGANISM="Scyphosphaera apsteinii, Strain RCC1455" /LENGTH=143 /DNA_ID=CAMNT_0007324677 /DNA_START=32 /DNA_END=462 /DNA_ORIENTATION=-
MDRSDYLPAERLQELAAQIDPRLQLEPQAEQVLQDVADDFVENVAAFACDLARHRGGKALEAKDVQLALEKTWNMRLPGVPDDGGNKLLRKPPNNHPTDGHKQRRAGGQKKSSTYGGVKPASWIGPVVHSKRAYPGDHMTQAE